jgi:transposase
MDKYDFLPCHHTITAETENYIIWALGSTPMSAIAAEIGVSVQTIANRANEFGRREREISVDGHYKRLSMDEIFIGRDKNGNHVVYWVLNDTSVPWKSNNILINRGRGETEIIERLKRLKHPETVEAVSVDMWRPYVQAVEEVFPNAAPVIDRFHVIKAAEESVNKARLSSKRSKEEKDAMKKDASLFLSSMYKLSDDELARLDGYLKADKRLETVYFLVQELLEFYYIKDYDSALEYLCSWETEVLQSGIDLPIYHTVLNWLPYIMNYFRFRITNGKMEGRNNLIRQIDRMGFHYKLDSLQGCLYAHDRRQEYIKWLKYLKRQYIKDKERMDTNSANMIQSEVA